MRYKVDLQHYLADCEANYLRLLKLFPNLAESSRRVIGLRHGHEVVVRVDVLERTPYTTLVCIRQQREEQASLGWLQLPAIKVRIYHDARVAEVTDLDGLRRPEPRCQYPNRQMLQQDEKAQWNQFLGEWLSQCMEFGYCVDPVFGAKSSEAERIKKERFEAET